MSHVVGRVGVSCCGTCLRPMMGEKQLLVSEQADMKVGHLSYTVRSLPTPHAIESLHATLDL